MNSTESKLAQLKDHLESAAFMVSKGASEKVAHSEILQSLVVLAEIRSALVKSVTTEAQDKPEMSEVNKVKRKLKRWAKRQDQINSRILNAFLKLERLGTTTITEIDLKNELTGMTSFESNFAQMKIIAEKNHGKIFEQYGEKISLWTPVIPCIREYENIVFGSK